MTERDQVQQAFDTETEFDTSPLYRSLSRVVATDESLLDLAAQGRRGQHPTFLFFGAVHYLLLSGVPHPLREFFPSVVGDQALPAVGAGPVLIAFCRQYESQLAAIIRTKLVQTNHVQRSLGLRIGLSAIAPELPGPIHLIEVGASAGLNLRFDRYGYRVGGRSYGDAASSVQIVADLYGEAPLPDLNVVPRLATVQGVDLNPVDVTDPQDRAWLEALVWPENHDQRALLAAALTLVAQDPPPIRAGDAMEVLGEIGAALPQGQPRVVFHSATRIHLPVDRLSDFDQAIESVGDAGPLWWLSIEDSPDPDPHVSLLGWGLVLKRPSGEVQTLAVVNGHLRWVKTLP